MKKKTYSHPKTENLVLKDLYGWFDNEPVVTKILLLCDRMRQAFTSLLMLLAIHIFSIGRPACPNLLKT